MNIQRKIAQIGKVDVEKLPKEVVVKMLKVPLHSKQLEALNGLGK